MADAICRLLRPLQSGTEAEILGPGLVREILYRSLCKARAPVLYSLSMHGGAFSQVARESKVIQIDCSAKIDVDQLANMARMSASAFHRAFKEITSDSPMQYLKKVRFTKARNLMVQQNMEACIGRRWGGI